MDKRFFMAPDVLVHLRVTGPSGKSQVLLDDVCGITYKEDTGKMPVYGYKDVYFQKAAISKSIVTGVLMVNKSFKHAIGGLVEYFLGGSIKATLTEKLRTAVVRKEVLTTNMIGDAELSPALKGVTAKLKEHKILMLRSTKQGTEVPLPTSIVDYTKLQKEFDNLVESEKKALLHFGLFTEAQEVSNTLAIQRVAMKHYTLIYNNNIFDATYSGYQGNAVLGKQGVKELHKQVLGNYLNGEKVTPISGVDVFFDLTNRALSATTVELAELEITIARINADLLKGEDPDLRSILSESLFASLNNAGLKVNLIVEYGRSGDSGSFTETLENCWFTSKSISPSVDNRDILKDMYQFFARKIT